MKSTIVQEAVIVLQNASVFISNTFIIDTKITANGIISYTIFIINCTFYGIELEIDSAKNITIVDSRFFIQNVLKNQDSHHILRVYNTDILSISDTLFGNQIIEQNEMIYVKGLEATDLGIKMENVSFAEIIRCSFSGIKSDVTNGSVIFLRKTELRIISTNLHFNVAKYGVIFAFDSVNITTSNCLYNSNNALKSGGVFYMNYLCTLTNDECIFQNNTSGEDGGVVYATHNVIIKNNRCLFQYNSAETGSGSVIWMQHNCQLTNKKVFQQKNVFFPIQIAILALISTCNSLQKWIRIIEFPGGVT